MYLYVCIYIYMYVYIRVALSLSDRMAVTQTVMHACMRARVRPTRAVRGWGGPIRARRDVSP